MQGQPHPANLSAKNMLTSISLSILLSIMYKGLLCFFGSEDAPFKKPMEDSRAKFFFHVVVPAVAVHRHLHLPHDHFKYTCIGGALYGVKVIFAMTVALGLRIYTHV